MNPGDFGINGGWYGLRTTKQYVSLFSDISGATDTRAMFYTNGQNLEINDLFTFTDGYAIGKYKNVSSTGVKGSDPTGNFPDTDFPMFRLADVYLMYAEAQKRAGTGGDDATALSYLNLIRERAYGNNSGDITSGEYTLDYILNERGRELQWECHRRTDLIRFGKYTSDSYLWAWGPRRLFALLHCPRIVGHAACDDRPPNRMRALPPISPPAPPATNSRRRMRRRLSFPGEEL